uniref:mRNA export factor GLE1 n=1 Tax=Eptatretus burgeri TaxID=7764 RepID=A0A8C4PY63_EPTBU
MDKESVLDELGRSRKGRLRYGAGDVEPGRGQNSLSLQLSPHLVKFLEKVTENEEVLSTPRTDTSPAPESITPHAQDSLNGFSERLSIRSSFSGNFLACKQNEIEDSLVEHEQQWDMKAKRGPPTTELLSAIQFHLLNLRKLAVAARQARTLHEQQLASAKMLQEQKDAARNRALEEQKKRQQEEEQKKREQEEEQKKQATEIAKGAVTVLDAWCQQLEQDMLDTERTCTTLSSSQDPQVKKIRSNINRAVAIPINQISSNAGSHLHGILNRLLTLLSGKPISSGGRMVSVSLHPQGLSFAQMKLADKFVCQGEEEVASHHEAAFPLAAVACGVWEEHPTFGRLLLAALQRRCPYVVPRHLARLSTQSQDDYFRTLGYKYSEDVLEKQDHFLKRMSGMMRLYAAILVAPPPTHLHKASQHGLCFAWRWLSQTLNLDPTPELTPTLLFDFLEVTGSAMMLHYKGQFWKLLLLLQKEYFARIKAVSNSDQMGPFNRLETFIQHILSTRCVPRAKGLLTDSFWRT